MSEYAQRIVGLLASGRRCGMSFDQAWARALEVAGEKKTWHNPQVELALFGRDRVESTPLEFLRERCRREFHAAPGGPRFDLDELLRAIGDDQGVVYGHRGKSRSRLPAA